MSGVNTDSAPFTFLGATPTELGYLHNVSSGIQAQLDNKQSKGVTTGYESADRGTIAAYSAGDSAVTEAYIAADAVVATGCTTGIAAAIASLSELSHQNNTTVLTALPSTASFTTFTIGTNAVVT